MSASARCRVSGVMWGALMVFALAGAGGELVCASTLPARGAVDARMRTASYSADEVYRLYGYVGFQIDLQFEPGESFVGLGAGDLDGLTFVSQDNHLFLKPRVAQVGTNLTVLTSRRHYSFEYSARAQRPDQAADEVMFAVRFIYPSSNSPDPAEQIGGALAQAPVARPQNLDYWFCGSSAIRPIAASDDGIHTRLRFAAKAEQPAVFVRNEDGSESLLNFSMEEGDVVIHRVARQFIVRRGRLTGCIVNRGFAGAGDRLPSHTVSPSVERAIRKGAP